MAYEAPVDSPLARYIEIPTKLTDDTTLIDLQDPYVVGTIHTNYATMRIILPAFNVTLGGVATTILVDTVLPPPMWPQVASVLATFGGLVGAPLDVMWAIVHIATGQIEISHAGAAFLGGTTITSGGITIEYPVAY